MLVIKFKFIYIYFNYKKLKKIVLKKNMNFIIIYKLWGNPS